MSSGRLIFLIFQLFFSATCFVLVSIRLEILGLQNLFVFTNPIVLSCGVVGLFGCIVVVWSKLS